MASALQQRSEDSFWGSDQMVIVGSGIRVGEFREQSLCADTRADDSSHSNEPRTLMLLKIRLRSVVQIRTTDSNTNHMVQIRTIA
jgi:hypothetical protein